ncbi:beta-galactosidase [Ruminococcaceae bacterium OttesenSCG-928-L11]|nr:beta-galactosidase [Ruminococcaceae bacterium OttesenSCG-928-L11]
MRESLLYGAAYYDEYMPCNRIQTDMQLMKEAGINVIRIAESTWATEEPQEGVFDFSHVRRALEAARDAGISVIVGTPTYAIPPWLAAKHPEVLAITEHGPGKYGRRQNMDITSPAYRFYAERIIRRLMECVQEYPNVIGVQLDNETKHYNTAGPNVHRQFVWHLRERFGTVEAMNEAFGFNYWSNRVDCWENVPDPTGTINGSFAGAFEIFRRGLVDEFLAWQSEIVREYLREDQFITHNFDYEWRNFSFGIQPDVNHKSAARAITLAGCDIYHPTQDRLTGKEIAFGGDVCRSLKQDNYLVLETQAQGHVNWTPYDGQLRLQAFSHVASGALGVMYWHWHSIHNAVETYWKGILSHDLLPNAAYREVCTIGRDFKRLGPQLAGLKKENRVAILTSNEALDGLRLFPLPGGKVGYNDIVRWLYDALYDLNVECDILFPEDGERFAGYAMLVVPALYSAPDSLLDSLNEYVRNGGQLLATFKTGFADETMTVGAQAQPRRMTACFGMTYDQFTEPREVYLEDDFGHLEEGERQVKLWMEFLRPDTAEVLARYRHPAWGKYAAVTANRYGKGKAVYIGCQTSPAYLKRLLERQLKEAGLWTETQEAPAVTIRSGVNRQGRRLHFYLNYSGDEKRTAYLHGNGTELLSGRSVCRGEKLALEPWGVGIYAEDA